MEFTKDDAGKPQWSLMTNEFRSLTMGQKTINDRLLSMSQSIYLDFGKVYPLAGEVIRYCDSVGVSKSSFLNMTAQALTFGKQKHGLDNWKQCDDPLRFADALSRHVEALLLGEECAEDTGISHIGHIGANLMFIEYFHRNPVGKKDRLNGSIVDNIRDLL